MGKHTETSAIIDGILKISVSTGVLATTILAPNALQALDGPLQKYFRTMDRRQREREWRRLTRYMRTNKLAKHDYQHGLVLTEKGRRRAIKAGLDSLAVQTPKTWDRKWRIIFYDVPEEFKTGRDSLTRRLKQLGFYQLQRSVWVHPFKCRNEVETLSANYGIEQYVSYIETSYIDKQEVLEKKFPNILN